jgi:uncharacterized protein
MEIRKVCPAMAHFLIMAKPIGPICNLNCTYCYYREKEILYGQQKNLRMKDELLESYIRQYINSQATPTVTFLWQGGEPTIRGVSFFERVVELQARYSDGKKIENALQTNGTLLDEKWGEFLARHGFLVGISIDGPEELHDGFRVDKGGGPTHSRVLRALDVLRRNRVEFNTLTAVHRKNQHRPLEVYRFLKEIGSRYLQFIPIVEEIAAESDSAGLRLLKPYSRSQTTVTQWSVEPKQYGSFLQTIFDEWLRADVATTFVNTFDVALESWVGLKQSLCVFARTCGTAMAMEHNGDVYSCDHYVYPDNKLGNIAQRPLVALATSPQQVDFGKAKELGLPKDCIECDVRFACNGECPKHRFLNTESGEPGLNYLCAGYKHFFHHVDPYMRFMANELRQKRLPANVMAWAREHQGNLG